MIRHSDWQLLIGLIPPPGVCGSLADLDTAVLLSNIWHRDPDEPVRGDKKEYFHWNNIFLDHSQIKWKSIVVVPWNYLTQWFVCSNWETLPVFHSVHREEDRINRPLCTNSRLLPSGLTDEFLAQRWTLLSLQYMCISKHVPSRECPWARRWVS